MNFAEEIFHRIFGARGVTESELDSASERRDLMEVQNKLSARLGRLSGDRLASAIALSALISRHLQTYPETPTELAAWRAEAERLTREARKYFGLSPVVIGTLFALGGGVAIALVVMRSRR